MANRLRIPALAALGLAALTACTDTPLPVSAAENEIAVQRARFLFEAACVSNTTRRAQERAFDAQNLFAKDRTRGQVNYVDPGALVFAALLPDYFDRENDEGQVVRQTGRSCAVGSPAISIRDANLIMRQIVATRFATGAEGDRFREIEEIGEDPESGAIGFFWPDMVLTVSNATVDITDQSGETTEVDLVSLNLFREGGR